MPAPDRELIFSVDSEKEIKILKFADLHFGVEGTAYHNADIERTLEFIDYAITTESPDLIVLLGDNMMSQGVEGARFIVETFDKYKIPYTFVFGNHDAELYVPDFTKRDVSLYLESCTSPYLLYKCGYIQDDSENRYGNFSISIRDKETKKLLGAFVIIDTGVYDYSKGCYQTITKEQIAWYKGEIEKLDAIYAAEGGEADTVPTITYGHIQLPEYDEAYRKAQSGEGAEFIYGGPSQSGGALIQAVSEKYGEAEQSFFEAMKEMQSAKAYICGHLHGRTYHVRMDGIILGFCPQSGVTNPNKKTITTFCYTLDKNFTLTPKLVTELRVEE